MRIDRDKDKLSSYIEKDRIEFDMKDFFDSSSMMETLLDSIKIQLDKRDEEEEQEEIIKTPWMCWDVNINNPPYLIKQIKDWSSIKSSAGSEILADCFSLKQIEEKLFSHMQDLEEVHPGFEDYVYERQWRTVGNGEYEYALFLVGFKKPLTYKEGLFLIDSLTYEQIKVMPEIDKMKLYCNLKNNNQNPEIVKFVQSFIELDQESEDV